MKERIVSIINQKSFRQLVKYGMVGIVGLIIDMGIYYLLVKKYTVDYPFTPFIADLLNGNMSNSIINTLISNIISSTLAIINNFILNSYFTFKVTDKKLKRFISFISIAAIGMIVSSMLLTLFIGIMGMDEIVAKALAIVIVAALQFVTNKIITFKEK